MIQSNIFHLLEADISKGILHQNALICSFVCAVGKSRPLLEAAVLDKINSMLVLLVKMSDSP